MANLTFASLQRDFKNQDSNWTHICIINTFVCQPNLMLHQKSWGYTVTLINWIEVIYKYIKWEVGIP